MRAMVLAGPGQALRMEHRPLPEPGAGEVRLRVLACAVCRTDLHVVDGDLPLPVLPIVPGHEIVGIVEALGPGVGAPRIGDRVGVPWLGHSCGHCAFCTAGSENLCDTPRFTGYHRDGGFASHAVAEAEFCLPLGMPGQQPDRIAPLMCAGLIGWRCLKAAGEGARRLGLYGFGAAAHLIAQVAVGQGRQIHAFTRPGDTAAQDFARSLGAVWAGGSDEQPAQPLDAAIIFAPVGDLVPAALRAVRKGGRVVCGGIHMSDIPRFPYRLLWEERQLVSVANLTRRDGLEFLHLAQTHPPQVHTTIYPLEQANEALADLRAGRLQGAAVLVPLTTTPFPVTFTDEFPMKHLTAADLGTLTEQLEAMKRRALDEIRSTSEDIDTNVQPGDHEVRSNADAAEIERLGDVRFAEIEIDRARLQDVEQAQRRIAEGRYGICAQCGNEIPVQRLLAQPTAVRCAACQTAAEREQR